MIETPQRRSALVTGASGAIGAGAARMLARAGWNVALSCRTRIAQIEVLGAELEAMGTRSLCLQADLAQPAEATAVSSELDRQWGGVDALVHGAGSFHRCDPLEQDPASWRAAFDDNLHSALFLSQALVPAMQRRGWGRLVFFTLVNGEQASPPPMISAHYLAKHSLLLLTRSLAKQLAPRGITVNAIACGFIAGGGAQLDNFFTSEIPLGRLGTVDDINHALQFLLSEGAAYLTGANLRLSGGWGL